MLRRTNIIVTMGCVMVLLLLSGCSTKKNTLTRRMYHNLTSHYNIYFNGELAVNDGEKQLRTAVKDDYTKVLRVYNYGNQQNGMAMNSTMDRALEKTSICVQKHSMNFGSRERVKWIDDAYLVMGKAHFYKHDYIPAKRTFDYVASEYSYNDISYVANMWLIKTYIQTEEYPKAVAMIEQLQAKTAGLSKPPKELMCNFDFTIADYFIAVKDYNNAVKYLKNGILLNKDHDLRTRAMFILGQIYMRQGDSERATAQFKKVIKRNPVYEMVFESRMNMAKVGTADNAKELYKMMNKMLRDSNNEDYRDRIYYAMAELALREGDETKAIDYLRKSVAAYKDNQIQRAQSSLKAATMFFEKNQYELAQAYYDTAVTSMNREVEGYDSIRNISQTLNELVMYANVVRDQDSLMRVAAMDSVSRNMLIDKIIAQVIEQEQIEKERREYEEQLALMGSTVGGNEPEKNPMEATSTAGGSWYFYNQTSVSKGITEFTRKWGMRKNEDNWRISDQRSLAAAMKGESGDEKKEEGKEGEGGKETASLTNHDRGYYLQDLPFTPEQKEVADSLIADGLYHLGFLYMDRLSDLPRSIESYEELDRRYPNGKQELPTWYALYKMHKDLGHEEQSLIYKSKIFDKYPTSSYAEFINDPTYFEKLQALEREASDFYSKTYEAFEQGQYYRVKMNTERAMQLYETDTAFMPRFAFLNAVAEGRLTSIDTMAFRLYNLVRDYPQSSITPYARRVLESVNEEYHLGLVLTDINKKEGGDKPEVKKEAPYTYEPNIEHFVMIVCDTKSVRVDPLMVRISDFNKKEHRTRNFNLKSVVLDDARTLITIGNFDSQAKATDYITSMQISDYVFGGIDKAKYQIVPISSKNYPVFYQAKNMDEYNTFMESNNNNSKQ
ncbi:MAG: tetratricopeptide repeat protein [Bacteroidales bacterium]|nr:tetratricopeptide repeat protein [Bacteroidales bacterium]